MPEEETSESLKAARAATVLLQLGAASVSWLLMSCLAEDGKLPVFKGQGNIK